MAERNYSADINLNGSQLKNAVIWVLAADPSGGSLIEGLFWYNSTSHRLKWYDGTGVRDITDAALLNGQNAAFYLARTNHTGTQTASTISDFDTQVRTNRLDQMAAPTGAVSMNSQRLTNVAPPTSGGDGTNRDYVDAVAAGMRDPKDAVRAATTAALPANTYANGSSGVGATLTGNANGALAAQDGVTPAAGDRLLVKNETAGANNGLYTITQVGSGGTPYILTRATDADTAAEVTQGMYVPVVAGTVNMGTVWLLSTADPITVGTTALTFIQVSAGSTAYTGTGGVDVTGTVISLVAGYNRYNADIGNGSATSITVTHNLGSRDVSVDVYDNTTPWGEVYPEVRRTSTSVVTLLFNVAPTTNQYRVVVKL